MWVPPGSRARRVGAACLLSVVGRGGRGKRSAEADWVSVFGMSSSGAPGSELVREE